jgi:predicted permease
VGVPAFVGGAFTEADDARGGRPDGAVVMVSYNFWQQRFGGAPDIVGRTLTLDRVPFRIVGVTPPGFFGLEVGETFGVVLPWGEEPLLHGRESCLDGRGNNCWLRIMARLRPGQTLQIATTALRAVQRQIWEATVPGNLRAEYRESYLTESFVLLAASTGTSYLRQLYTRPLVTVMVVVALVLLIACANVANVLLARGIARRHELSVRLALGASRSRLVRQLLIEAIVLTGTATAVALAIAFWGSRLLAAQLSTRSTTVFLDVSMDWRVLLFTTSVAVTTALLFGVAPAFYTSRVAPMDAMKVHRRGATGAALGTLSSGLVVAQIVVSVVLVVAAGLFVRTFASLATRPLGFDRDHVLLVNLDAQQAVVAPAQRVAMYDHIRDTVRSVPGVRAVAVSMVTPVGGMGLGPHIEVSGGVPVQGNAYGMNGVTNVVTPDWFETFGTPLIAGRDFTERDRPGSPRVAIVNQTLARKFLNSANPIGHTISLGTPGRSVTMDIVGVVADAVYSSVSEVVPATVYTPLAQFYLSPTLLASVNLSVRSRTGSPAMLRTAVAASVGRVNPDLSLTFRVLADQVNASLRQERLVATLSGFFGALALLLAGLGLYGVTSYAVSRRRTEFGIRMALGAPPSRIVQLVLWRVALLVGAGVTVGAIVSLWASKFVASLLYGLEPRDPGTFASAVIVLTLVAAFAAWVPARRASRTDPAITLRCD